MECRELNKEAKELADITLNLIVNCQEKEIKIARIYGLAQAEFRCLRYFNADEEINNKDIAGRMELSPGRLTRIIDGLVKKGLVKRELILNDRRNMKVSLSSSGVLLLDQINELYLNIHKEILNEINEVEYKQIIKALKVLVGSLDKWISRS